MGGGILRWLIVGAYVACARPCDARVVINELYYDHPGTDTGHEFIELHSTTDVDLSGAAIEFHNGTGTTWTLVWRAAAGTHIGAQGILLVGGELVVPAPDAVISFALQNGPDAIRLVSADGGLLDTVGYGGLDQPGFVEGVGVAPVAAGRSIARVLDGVDSDDNSLDFAAAVPTPGRHNVAREDVALERAPGTAARASRTASGRETIAVRIENRGLRAVAAGEVALEVVDSTASGVSRTTGPGNQNAIPAGGEERAVAAVTLDEGYHWLAVHARFARDEREENNSAEVLRRVGRIPLLVSEVWSTPRDGCPQFVECFNAGPAPIDATGFALRDERARPVIIDADSLFLEPGQWIALTADPERLAACVPGTPRARLFGMRGAWPTFNRSGGAHADSVVIVDRHGIQVDAVSYPAVPASAAGRSLERIDLFLHDGSAAWRLSGAARGCTPAMANEAFIDRAPPPGRIIASPNPFAPRRGEVLRVAAACEGVARIHATVFDLEGRALASLGGVSSFPGLLLWNGRRDDGTAVRPGLYLLAVEMYGADGARMGVEKVVVGCAPDDAR
jgi:hypothetical protein